MTFTYLSLGAGVQSTALLVMSCKGLHGCPRADAAVFADTMDEPAWVYAHLEWCRAFGMENGVHVEVVSAGKLSANLRTRSFVPFFTGKDGMLLRKCTNQHKIQPIRRWVRGKVGLAKGQRAKGVAAHALIGISTDEAVRAKDSRDKWIVNRYPLLDAGMSRSDCLRLLRDHGVPIPKKSACVFCPYHSNAYWQDLKANHAEEFEKACAFDERARREVKAGVREPIYIHRARRPLREIDFTALGDIPGQGHLFSLEGFGNECEGMCGV